MQHTSIARDEQRPEIQPPMSLEGEEDLYIQLHDIVPGDRREGCYGHKGGLLEGNRLPGRAIVLLGNWTHDAAVSTVRVLRMMGWSMMSLSLELTRKVAGIHQLELEYGCGNVTIRQRRVTVACFGT